MVINPTCVGKHHNKKEGEEIVKNLEELPRLKDSISYIYLEHAVIQQEDLSIVAIREDGKIPVPIAAVTCLLLGPGVSITHAAIRAICDNGCMAIWCGENMGRFYASGIGETRSASNLLMQAKLCMDSAAHLEVASNMYRLRFPDIPTEGMTLAQLRGMEGIRMRKTYELESKRTGVAWKKRSYQSKDWDSADPINRALSEANALLYGVCHAAVVSLGFSPGLGFIHTGKQLSFVYDIADLYKAETTIPAAFEAVRESKTAQTSDVRMQCRKYFAASRLLSRIPEDIQKILRVKSIEIKENCESAGELWGENGTLQGGRNYSEEMGRLL